MTTHIAFVDDEIMIHKLVDIRLRDIIKEYDITVHHFLDGKECYNYFLDNELEKITAVFSDISMPEMDGIELVSFLRKEHPNTLCYFISALAESEYKNIIGNMQDVGVFAKPIDFNAFVEELHNICKN